MSAATATTTAPAQTERSGAARRTMLALLACCLGAFPLKALLADTRWLGEAWLTMAIVVAPAALLRRRRAPSALDIWPGIFLLIPWLTLIYLPHHAWHGVVPTGATFTDLNHLMNNLHHTTSSEVAPIQSTPAVRLVISALLGLLAALIDLIAVVGRRGALAGVPLLIVYTVSGAVPRQPVSWVWFTFAAIGYLILLGLDAADDLRQWGRRISRVGSERGKTGLGFSGQRIGIVAIIVAIALPLLLPSHVKNLLADAFRGGGGGGLGSFGVNQGGTSINPYIDLKGQLERNKPIELMRVHVDGTGVVPFYVRLNVLDTFTGEGWRASDHGFTEPVGSTSFGAQPASGRPQTVGYQATITITNLSGNLPVFTTPVSTTGLDADATWSPQDQLLLGSQARAGEVFTETVAQPAPTIAQLQASPVTAEPPDLSRWMQLPALPNYVSDLVSQLTAQASTSYDKARAIFQYFADPKNGFVYTLETAKGDSGSDLVDFLQHKRGFCQQYAGAMAVMLRKAGVPARIVLGYMHSAPDQQGDFSVSTFDAHSWVEAFFPGAGWVPFDPTPAIGLAAGKQGDLPWAQHVWPNGNITGQPTVSNSATGRPSVSAGNKHGGGQADTGASSSTISYSMILTGLIVVALIGIALVPAALRWSRRRARLAAARRGDTDALWAELSDTAIDLGYVWSAARTPRQVAAWLASDAGDAAPALTALATAVEQGRYARVAPIVDGQPLSAGLVQVTDRLWSRRSGSVRLRARLWPASLGWSARLRRAGSALRKH